MTSCVRGQVYWATFDDAIGRTPWLVVSNNVRNRRLADVLVARITTSPKPPITSIVELPHGACIVGSVLCDDLLTMYEADAPELVGALSRATMHRVDAALAAALGVGSSA